MRCVTINYSSSYVIMVIRFHTIGPIRVPLVQFKLFSGTVVHTAFWDSSIDFTNKKVAMIGNGASTIQVLPAVQKSASQLYSYQRSVSWCTKRNQFCYLVLGGIYFQMGTIDFPPLPFISLYH